MVTPGLGGVVEKNWQAFPYRSNNIAVARSVFIRRLQQSGFDRGRILDVGSNTGEVVQELAWAFPEADITGLDLTGEYLQVPAAMLGNKSYSSRVTFKKGSATGMPFEDRSFDTVVGVNALRKTDKPVTTLDEIERILKPGGLLILYESRKSWLKYVFSSLRYAYTAEEIQSIVTRSKLRQNTITQGTDWVTITVLPPAQEDAGR
ncbi:MAG TPA: class I SAM-dependent methyltransferase [Methanocella sp.]|nr:class I SAM-dependent methyltransferase [Methanocella sp.]